jgi:hypothetical protein
MNISGSGLAFKAVVFDSELYKDPSKLDSEIKSMLPEGYSASVWQSYGKKDVAIIVNKPKNEMQTETSKSTNKQEKSLSPKEKIEKAIKEILLNHSKDMDPDSKNTELSDIVLTSDQHIKLARYKKIGEINTENKEATENNPTISQRIMNINPVESSPIKSINYYSDYADTGNLVAD